MSHKHIRRFKSGIFQSCAVVLDNLPESLLFQRIITETVTCTVRVDDGIFLAQQFIELCSLNRKCKVGKTRKSDDSMLAVFFACVIDVHFESV